LKSKAISKYLKDVVAGKPEAIDNVCQEIGPYLKKLQEILNLL
jgi:hypothetical protein